MSFKATCSPGPRSTVSIRWTAPDLPALVLFLDPESVAIQLQPLPDGDLVLIRFLREMSREAGKLAVELEAQRVAGPPPEEPTTTHERTM